MDSVPVPQRIEVEGGAGVVLTWEDGTVTAFDASELRAACACATCREPDGVRRTREVLEGPVPVTIDAASLVGGYAINFVFGPDGHGTGIFPFAELRALGDGPRGETAG